MIGRSRSSAASRSIIDAMITTSYGVTPSSSALAHGNDSASVPN